MLICTSRTAGTTLMWTPGAAGAAGGAGPVVVLGTVVEAGAVERGAGRGAMERGAADGAVVDRTADARGAAVVTVAAVRRGAASWSELSDSARHATGAKTAAKRTPAATARIG